ncbi:MAG: hypothetical protein RLZZ167_729 [Pseudomonadota bacterium]|jgi:hypothetical protein
MKKTLEQIQKENRKFILEAIHGCSYDEALKKEIGFGCDIVVQNYVCGVKDTTEIITLDKSIVICDLTGLFVFAKDNKPLEIIEIIGKPITLNRVLLAIPCSNIEIECDRFVFKKLTISNSIYKIDKFDWDLTSETLEQQSEETQREINKIFTGE